MQFPTYLVLAVAGGYWGQLPFIALFLSGYVGLGFEPGLLRSVPRPADAVEAEHREERDPEQGPQPGGLEPVPAGLVGAESEVPEEYEAA